MAAEPGVEMAPLYNKRIEHEKIKALKEKAGNFEAWMEITEDMKEDM